jgi:hypothetical protein
MAAFQEVSPLKFCTSLFSSIQHTCPARIVLLSFHDLLIIMWSVTSEFLTIHKLKFPTFSTHFTSKYFISYVLLGEAPIMDSTSARRMGVAFRHLSYLVLFQCYRVHTRSWKLIISLRELKFHHASKHHVTKRNCSKYHTNTKTISQFN